MNERNALVGVAIAEANFQLSRPFARGLVRSLTAAEKESVHSLIFSGIIGAIEAWEHGRPTRERAAFFEGKGFGRVEAELTSLRADLQRLKANRAEAALHLVTEERDQAKELVRLWMAAGEESEAALRDLRAKIQAKAEKFVADVESCEDLRASRDWDGHPNPFDLYVRETYEYFSTLLASGVAGTHTGRDEDR